MDDLVSGIIALESGEMSQQEAVNFIAHLANTRTLFSLQGSYQRTLQQMLDAGLIVAVDSGGLYPTYEVHNVE